MTTMTQISIMHERNFMFVYIVDKFLCDNRSGVQSYSMIPSGRNLRQLCYIRLKQ